MDLPEWLTASFIENALKNADKDSSISVTNIEVMMATSIGDNNNSKMYRVSCDITRRELSKTVTTRSSVIVKVAHSTQQLQKELIEDLDIFGVEINMMTEVLKDMESILKNTKLSGRCYFSQQNNPPILVLEDLAPLGFRMADRQAGLDLDHCTLVIRNVAKFHASSLLLYENKPKVKEFCSKGVFGENCPPTLREFMRIGMKSMVKAAKSWPELSKKCIEKLENLQESALFKAFSVLKLREYEFNVINHGDVWVNNLMFKYDNKGNVIDQIFVDFQACFYGTPALDLQYFLHTSLNEKSIVHHKNFLIKEYQETLSLTMKRIGCKTCVPSLQYIKKILFDCEIFGFLIASTGLPIMMASKNHAKELDDMVDDGEFNAGVYNNENYRVRMVRMLKEWDDLGVLDGK
ncbi:hypothetical protein G9C98_001423 [Cotesia typhae]|uniref:CHK kinase-like domain-containing protein n=1 Tax=Cotesia typhae TaxID=2053667 RepID=A0A8J5QWX1_9HYME|nr:hypothetical protein G9C98_001423 [Cotesia typhae]